MSDSSPPPPQRPEERVARATTLASRERIRLLVSQRGRGSQRSGNRGQSANFRRRLFNSGGTPNPPEQPETPPFKMGSDPIPTAVLNALSPGKQAALHAWARTAVAPVINLPTVRVRQANINIKIPNYDPLRKTATGYLEEVEAYFKSQGVEEAEFLEVVSTVLEDHTISWLRSKRVIGYTWAQFKADFTARFDGVAAQQRRQNYLVTRKQREDEPVETFVWEMMDLAKQVFPTETTAESVERCRSALHPRLKVALMELTTFTAEHLIDRCQSVIQDLRALDRVEGRSSELPPMYSNERFKHFISFQQVNEASVSDRHPGSWNRGHANEGQGNDHWTSIQINQAACSSGADSRDTHVTRGSYRGPGNQGGSRHVNTTCYQCGEIGHIASHCPEVAWDEDKVNEEEVDDPEHSNNAYLNEEGGHQT